MVVTGIALLAASVVVPAMLVILWLLGLVAGYTVGGFIRVLLLLAIVLFPSLAVTGIILIVRGSRKT
jgi:hypothetical protein